MFEIKTELQIRYHSITDLANYIRTIVSPYTKVAENIRFDPVNRPSERALINFPDDGMMISLDWNVLVVFLVGKTTDLNKRNGVFRYCYDIFEKVISLDTYNGINFIYLKTWDLIPDKYTDYKEFRDEFFTSNLLHIKNSKNDDCAIILKGRTEKDRYEYNITFGPFDHPDDIKNHNLTLYNENIFNLEGTPKKGCLVNTLIKSVEDELNMDMIKNMLTFKSNVIKSIKS